MDQLQGFHAVLPTSSKSIGECQSRLAELLEDLEFPDRDRFSVRLAVEEALVNALKHGNCRDESRAIEVTCQANGDLIRVEIRDEGAGFDPQGVKSSCEDAHLLNPNGRGIALMRQFMDRVEFNGAGNRVVLEKQRSDIDLKSDAHTEAVCV